MPYYIHFHSYTILVKKEKGGSAVLKKRKKKLYHGILLHIHKVLHEFSKFIQIKTIKIISKLHIFCSKLNLHIHAIGITIAFTSIMNNKPVFFVPSCNERITIETRASFSYSLGKNLKRQMKAIKVLK